MRTARRHDLSPRVEIMPLIDVVFVLLTFYIYALVLMVHAEILPVQLQTLTTGRAAEPAAILAITVDSKGGLYLNRAPVTTDQLDERLNEVAQFEDPPKLFLALEDNPPTESGLAIQRAASDERTTVDRGPLLIELIERVRRAGLEDFNIVGQRAGG